MNFVYSLFGKAFEQAAKNKNCYIEADYFDSTSKYGIKFYELRESGGIPIIFNIFPFYSNKTENRGKT